MKSKDPKISVIIPVYKEQYLVECLNSVINQTLKEIEIIIVDKGKKNRCQEIVDYYAKNDPRIIAPHIENDGYGASANIGLKLAKGEYIAIVESDDFIEPEMYEEMYTYAKDVNADVVKTPCYEYFCDKPRKDCSYRKFMYENTPRNLCFSMKEFGEMLQIHASIWSGIYRKEYMRNNDISFIEAPGAGYIDVGFRIHSLIHSDRIAWLDKPYYNYRIDSNASSTNSFNLTVMLTRWKEVHEYFMNHQNDYDKYYGKHLILDEYNNSILIAMRKGATQEDINLMKYNYSFVKEETIEESSILSKLQKQQILTFKNCPNELESYINSEEGYGGWSSIYSEEDSCYAFPINDVSPEDRVIIYGAGVVGKVYIKQIITEQYCHIVAVCDKNYMKINLPSVNVISPIELSRMDENGYDVIIVAVDKSDVAEVIKIELEDLGIRSNKIKWIKPNILRENV